LHERNGLAGISNTACTTAITPFRGGHKGGVLDHNRSRHTQPIASSMKSSHLACFCLAFALASAAVRAETEPAQPVPGDGPASAPEQAKSRPDLRRAGMACVKMSRPELPALPWRGQIELRVLATVRDGRVRSIAHRSIQTNQAIPTRELFVLLSSVETALAGYECPGEHVFEQSFRFVLN
jgi:hypothetical protein